MILKNCFTSKDKLWVDIFVVRVMLTLEFIDNALTLNKPINVVWPDRRTIAGVTLTVIKCCLLMVKACCFLRWTYPLIRAFISLSFFAFWTGEMVLVSVYFWTLLSLLKSPGFTLLTEVWDEFSQIPLEDASIRTSTMVFEGFNKLWEWFCSFSGHCCDEERKCWNNIKNLSCFSISQLLIKWVTPVYSLWSSLTVALVSTPLNPAT